MAVPKVRQFTGDIRLWQKDNTGTLLPVIPESLDPEGNQPIETSACSFSYAPGEEITLVSRRNGSLEGQPFYNRTRPGITSMTLGLMELPPAILARVLYGEAADVSVTTGTLADGSVTVERLDGPIQLGHRYIKSSPAPTIELGATALVLGTDYKIDRTKGTIVVLSAGTVGATVDVGDVLTVNYDYESVTGIRILGGATPTESFFITGDMRDVVSEDLGYLQIYEARLTVDGEIDWLSTEPLSPTLTGPLIVPNGAPAPYTFDVYKQA